MYLFSSVRLFKPTHIQKTYFSLFTKSDVKWYLEKSSAWFAELSEIKQKNAFPQFLDTSGIQTSLQVNRAF